MAATAEETEREHSTTMSDYPLQWFSVPTNKSLFQRLHIKHTVQRAKCKSAEWSVPRFLNKLNRGRALTEYEGPFACEVIALQSQHLQGTVGTNRPEEQGQCLLLQSTVAHTNHPDEGTLRGDKISGT